MIEAGVPVRVEVTREDVDRGTPLDASSCPIALALRRLATGMEGGDEVEVGDEKLIVDGLEAVTPLAAVEFIEQFDATALTPGPRPASLTFKVTFYPRDRLGREDCDDCDDEGWV